MTRFTNRLRHQIVNFYCQNTAAAGLLASRAPEAPVLDEVLALFAAPGKRSEPDVSSPRPRPLTQSGVEGELARLERHAAVLDGWLAGRPDALRGYTRDAEAVEDVEAVEARWSGLETLERQAGEAGRRLILESGGSERVPLLCRLMIVHLATQIEMMRTAHGARRGGWAAADERLEATFRLYAEALREAADAAVTARSRSIAQGCDGGIIDPWADDEYAADWTAWYEKVLVNEPNGSQLQHYLAHVTRDLTLELQDAVAGVVRCCATAVGVPPEGWYAGSSPLRFGDRVVLRGGSAWPIGSGGLLGAAGTLDEDEGPAVWTLLGAQNQQPGAALMTEDVFQLQSTSDGRYLHDSKSDCGPILADGPQAGGSFFVRAMEIPRGQPATTRATYFLVGAHSGAYLQIGGEGALGLRPWTKTDHAGPVFPTWSFVEAPAPTPTPTLRAATPPSEKDLTVAFFNTMGHLTGIPPFQMVGTVIGLVWPKEPVPTWAEIRAEFTRMIGEALATFELGQLSNYIDGIERKMQTYHHNASTFGPNANPLQLDNLADELKSINGDLLLNLSNVLYSANAGLLQTLPYFWKVARYKTVLMKELELYENTAFDTQFQINAFVDESRTPMVAVLNQLMSNRMGEISSSPERYNEGFGAYLLRYRDARTGQVFNVSNSAFMTTTNCHASVDYAGYNNYARNQLKSYRRKIRDSFLRDVIETEVVPFNALVELTKDLADADAPGRSAPITMVASGDDSWTVS
ncbi:hypothetical protein DB30_06811 [Enhygromyxa salina]|uniref:Uncharacterized protein n=1 Tax=Enhygromyxa salina TaxID=215803 RepID=A0A0C1ZTT7_9BACT|nr:hypothetical protein [Enhygromyxa salina]KIG14468.1 hypothetical protein DB30_06811 [Enhygromyxa salina]